MQVVKKRFLLAFCIAFVGFMIAVPTFAEIDVEPQNIGTEDNPVEYSTGDIDEVQITLDNIGQDAIDFNVEIEVTAEPEEERANRDDRSEPDDMGWEWRDSDDADGPVFEWVDITEWDGTRHWNLQDDQNTGAVDFGFTFPFWDREFEQIYINSDAWTSFTYGGNSWNNNPQNFPVEAADNAVSATWIHLRQFDYTENNQAWYWTNENDQAIISWIGDGSHNFQLILTDDGKGVMQIGENCDARHLGVNLGDGDHGWHIGSYAAGSAIGFGPADAWTQWIAIDNDGGTIEADERDSLMVTFNFEGMIGGPYEATITIFTTDEEQAEILVPVWLDVTDAADIEVEWAEDAGFPDIINWNNVYRDGIFLDQEYDIPIMIYNVGTENLNIESIASDSNQFTAAPAAEIVIEPEGELEVVITFIAAEPDEYQAVMAITSNDPRGVFEIDLIARTAVPPVFVIDPDNVTRTGENSLYTGDYEVYPLTISNDGDADLIWSLEVEIVEEERDNNIRSLRSTSANAPNRDRGSAEPDEWGYEWRDNMNDNESDAPEFEWIDLEEYDDVTDIAMADDVVRGPYDLGWDFPYYDHTGDRVWVCSDGWISPT
ncbi:MAG: hypothetical protein HQ568_00010, partial [Calditrichaeota bacterium]|nr:hypothetical protein [Calditrichota bacterium]